MRRYVVNKIRGNYDREVLQTCIVYPTSINKKRVKAENEQYSHKREKLIFDKKTQSWRYEK